MLNLVFIINISIVATIINTFFIKKIHLPSYSPLSNRSPDFSSAENSSLKNMELLTSTFNGETICKKYNVSGFWV